MDKEGGKGTLWSRGLTSPGRQLSSRSAATQKFELKTMFRTGLPPGGETRYLPFFFMIQCSGHASSHPQTTFTRERQALLIGCHVTLDLHHLPVRCCKSRSAFLLNSIQPFLRERSDSIRF
ncbi:hypothetical protein NPIL_280941 [Nephila pilipes]|uniref:Uncharacterized protein n=1 Tax=Nephila pilipes TaxID=299642 RepID=A0A8X6MES5_NEPPI|nr:hypothetical protein NPIL_280941 [Nephila pilipes]